MSDKAETGETAEIDVGEPMAAPERSGSVEQTEGRGPSGRVGRTEGRGPFAGLSPKPMRRLLIVSGAITLLLFIALAVIDLRIKRSGGPGIIALEVAGSTERAAEILRQWGDSGRSMARVSLIVDFPFLVAYAIFFGAACTEMGRRLRVRAVEGGTAGTIAKHLASPAPILGWAFFVAAALDVVENLALLRVIDFHLTWATTAQIAASPKFAIFGAGLFFLLASLLLTARPLRRVSNTRQA